MPAIVGPLIECETARNESIEFIVKNTNVFLDGILLQTEIAARKQFLINKRVRELEHKEFMDTVNRVKE